jgi:hypothetical protein
MGSETVFTYKVKMTLAFEPLTKKSIGVIYSLRPMHLCSLSAKAPWIVKLLIGNCFTYKVNMTLTIDHNINRGHLLAKTNAPTKFEGQGPMGCQVIDWK